MLPPPRVRPPLRTEVRTGNAHVRHNFQEMCSSHQHKLCRLRPVMMKALLAAFLPLGQVLQA